MSKYTTELRYICESLTGLEKSVGYNDTNNVIKKARKLIFDFDYPLFDPTYKPVLETKILRHFYTREIGAETYGLWKMWLETRMNEVMPYFNKLYESELLQFDPFRDVDLTTEHSGANESNGSTTSKTTTEDSRTAHTTGTDTSASSGSDETNYTRDDKNNTWDLYSDTPQGGINGIVNAEGTAPSVGNNGYLTNARHTFGDTDGSEGSTTTDYGRTDTMTKDDTNQVDGNSESNSDGSSELHSTDEYLNHMYGKTAGKSYAKLLREYRDTFLNIDMDVIHSLDDLFFNLW